MTNITKPYYRRRVAIDFSGEQTLTEQHHLNQCSMKKIMERYQRSGIIDHLNQYQGTYADFSNTPEYQEAQNIIAAANSMFETVPAQIRDKFDNDPGKFVDFMQNNQNIDKIEEMGLSASHLTPIEQALDPIPTPTPTLETAPAPTQPLSEAS